MSLPATLIQQPIRHYCCTAQGKNSRLYDYTENHLHGIEKNSQILNYNNINSSPRYASSLILSNTHIVCAGAETEIVGTIAFWTKSNVSTPTNQIIFINPQYKLMFGFDAQGQAIIAYGTSQNLIADLSLTWNENKWNHIAITRTDDNISCYINGQLINLITMPSNNWPVTSYNSMTIGGTGNDCAYGGLLSDFRVYENALAPLEIERLYMVPISLQQDGTFCAAEFVEADVSTPAFLANGLVKINTFTNIDNVGHMQLLTDTIQTTDFIEW